MKTLLVLMTVLLLALGAAAPAHAGSGVDSQARGLFGDVMTNSTSPGIVNGARRGEIFGGSFEARNKIMNLNLVSFAPPSISAGCNGINAFMGSFSFISTAQLVAALRSVATAAIGYAFRLALGSMCPMCEKIMAALQAVMNSVNNGDRNTCQIAENLMNMGGQNSIASSIAAAGTQFADSTGLSADNFDASMWGKATTAIQQVFQDNPQGAADIQAGNIVWEALSDENVGTWPNAPSSLFDPHTFMEELMSFTGTMTICASTDPSCTTLTSSLTTAPTQPASNASPHTGSTAAPQGHSFPSLMTLSSLVEGSTTAGRTVNVYHCMAGPKTSNGGQYGAAGCTSMTVSQLSNFMGLRSMVCTVLLGNTGCAAEDIQVDPSLGTNNGLIQDLVAGNAPTANEEAMLEFGGEPVQMAVRLALNTNTEMANDFLAKYISAIALQVAYHIAQSDLKMVMIAVGQHQKDHQNYQPLIDQMNTKVSQNMADYQVLAKKYQMATMSVDFHDDMASAVQVSDPVGRRTPSIR